MTRLHDWEVLEQVGAGSSAVVHRAVRRDRPGRVVALKRLRDLGPGAVDDLEREAAVLAELSHPAIAVLHEVVVEADEVVLVLALATGGSLADRLARRGRLPWIEVADLGARLADGLAAAHDAGVVHRDVKPSNVLFGREDEPRLADFGLARVGADADARIAGTPGYLDPDVAAGGVPGPRADQWSLGVLLWQALAGQHPFAGADAAAIARAADRGDHLPLADLVPAAPPELVAAVERAMARDPADRFANLGALHGVLAAVATSPAGSPDHDRSPRVLAASRPSAVDRAVDLGPAATPDPAPDPPPDPTPAPTTTWGPRPPRPEPVVAPRRPAWSLRVAVGLLAAAPLVVAGWAVARTLDDPARVAAPAASEASPDPVRAVRPVLDPTAAATRGSWPPRSVPPPCPSPPGDPSAGSTSGPGTDPVGGDSGGPAVHADVDARGCSVAVHTREPASDAVDGGLVLVVEGTGPVAGRWELDLAARDVLFGDWDGDGDDTPAVVDDDGSVWVFADWAEASARRTDVRADGAVHVVTDPGGRDHVVAAGPAGADVIDGPSASPGGR